MFGNWVTYNYEKILYEIERKIQKDASILDVGCGGGLVLGLLSKVSWNHHLVGMDISRKRVKIAKKRRFEVIIADARHLPFRTSSFDYVFLKDLLHHTQEPITCLKNIKQVCKKNMVIVEVNKNNPAMVLARSIHSEEKHFTSHQLKSLIERSDLQIKNFTQMHVYPMDFVVNSKNPVISIWNAFIGKLTKKRYPATFFVAFLLIIRIFVRTPSYNIVVCD